LRDALSMINNRFNALASWDNESGDRYAVELEIVSVDIDVEGNGNTFPTIEILQTNIIDKKTGKRTQGIVGNNFSSYVRDYDFSVRLSNHNRGQSLAFVYLITIVASLRSVSLPILVICTESCLSISLIQKPIKHIFQSCRSFV